MLTWDSSKMISTLDKCTMSMTSEDHTMQYCPFLPYIIITSHSVAFYNIAVNVNIPVAVMLLRMWDMAK